MLHATTLWCVMLFSNNAFLAFYNLKIVLLFFVFNCNDINNLLLSTKQMQNCSL